MNGLGLLSDRQITELCTGDRPMITPFEAGQIRKIEVASRTDSTYSDRKVISFGVCSYGYDIQLAAHDFLIFKSRNIWQKLGLQKTPIIDPKRFDPDLVYKAKLHSDRIGNYFILPSHGAALGVSHERFDMPNDINGYTMGKSTYARCAIDQLGTPIESGWRGHLTLEFSNNSDLPCKVYANEGIMQIVFVRGSQCDVPYSVGDRKYQNQDCNVTLARV